MFLVIFVIIPGASPVLIVSNRYYLRNMSLDGAMVHLIADNLHNSVALDFDWAERMIYWSDVVSTGSNISRMNADGTGREVSYIVMFLLRKVLPAFIILLVICSSTFRIIT